MSATSASVWEKRRRATESPRSNSSPRSFSGALHVSHSRKARIAMRTLFIVRGAPGIGKSTFLSLYQARGQVVSLDGIRDVFAMPVPDWDGVPGRSIRGGTEETISRVLESALRSRFEQGGDVLPTMSPPVAQQTRTAPSPPSSAPTARTIAPAPTGARPTTRTT